jgi:hypothetical protein
MGHFKYRHANNEDMYWIANVSMQSVSDRSRGRSPLSCDNTKGCPSFGNWWLHYGMLVA